ncbi:MAG: ATP-binding protein [Patescibacteria group bacterium]|nr:ATP-binding protein [Patescibacteria group bacterium]MBU1953318.1 ATP-binding protein [Patescibacteria group bacterium]
MYISRLAEDNLKKWFDSGKVLLLLGARQVGKTTLLKNAFKLERTTYLNLDIEVDRQRLLSSVPLDPKSSLSLLGSPEILIVDEAQRVPEISRVVKGWYDFGVTTKIILSGSSSLNLLDQSAETLTGRNIKLFLPPLTFSEIISSQSWYQPELRLDKGNFRDQTDSILFTSLIYGSYPEAVKTLDKREYLNNLISDYLLKDILQVGLVKSPGTLRKLLLLLAYQVGSVVSINEIAGSLGISRQTVVKYLDLLEETFVIFQLPAYSTNPRKEISKSNKIYFWDTGVRNALIGEMQENNNRGDIGKLWENWVIAEFAKRNLLLGKQSVLYYWRSRNNSEVDLVVKNSKGEIQAFEIKWSKSSSKSKAFTSLYHLPVEVINMEKLPLILGRFGILSENNPT